MFQQFRTIGLRRGTTTVLLIAAMLALTATLQADDAGAGEDTAGDVTLVRDSEGASSNEAPAYWYWTGYHGWQQREHDADRVPAPPYTVEMKEAHLEHVIQSPYVSPTASGDERFTIGWTRGWSVDDYPFDVDAVEYHRITEYVDFDRYPEPIAALLDPAFIETGGDIPSHPIYGYRITDPEADGPKAHVLLTEGNHTIEHTASWGLEGMVDFLISDDPRAQALRRHAVFFVYPSVNPDGLYTLTGTCNPEIASSGDLNHNRIWGTAGLYATIDALVPAIRYDMRGRADFSFDFHSARRSSFYYVHDERYFDSPFARAMRRHEPDVGPRSSPLHQGHITGRRWAGNPQPEGLGAAAFTPEYSHEETIERAREIGRSYALALYDVLIGDLADEPFDYSASTDPVVDVHVAPDGLDPLLAAAKRGDHTALADLLNEDHGLSVTDHRGNTALHLAAAHGHGRLVELLLEHGARWNVRNNAGRLPIYLATEHGHDGIAAALREIEAIRLADDPDLLTAPPDGVSRNWGFTPLHRAAGAGEAARIELLLDHGAPVDRTDHVLRTPLRHAAEGGHTRAAALLIEHGADVNALDSSGNTPLHLAAQGCRLHREHWFTYCRGEDCRETEVYCAEGYSDLAVLLLEHRADASARNHRGWTPLHYAARYGQTRTAAKLIEHGADVHAAHDDGDTPLHIAASYDHAEIVRMLLDAGADPATSGRWGRTAGDWARRLGYAQLLEILE